MHKRTPIHDEPNIEISLLQERQSLLRKLVEDIKECEPPMVFGVHGDWGAGKTSFLQAVMRELTGNCPCHASTSEELKARSDWKSGKAPVAVWFEAWRYQNESSPVVALLHELRAQLAGWASAMDTAKQTAKIAWRNCMLALDSIILKIESETGFPGPKGSVQINPFQMAKAREDVQKARLTTPLPSNQIREALDEVLRGLLTLSEKERDSSRRIIIFIDDLDRCSASAMFSLLESIKIYLNLRHCVFVLGINRHELERNIASVLPEPIALEHRQVRAHEYLEKLCGNVIRLPYPSPEGQIRLVQKWLAGIDEEWCKDIVELVRNHKFLPQNPRRIKMWCNTVLQFFDHRCINEKGVPELVEAPALTLMATLHTFYPALHQALAAAPSFILALKKWCLAEQRMEPELDVFDGLLRVFVDSKFITMPSPEEESATWSNMANGFAPGADVTRFEQAQSKRIESLKPILKRAYSWSGETLELADEASAEAPQNTRIPLLTDPSSLQYFHPQVLVAEEHITEVHIKPYLHILS